MSKETADHVVVLNSRTIEERPDQRRYGRRLAPFGVALFVLMVCVLYAATNDLGVPRWGTIDDALHSLGGQDGGSYLRGGEALLSGTLFAPENVWLVNLWPPGMFVYMAGMVAVSSVGLPIALVLAGVTALAWALVLAVWFSELRHRSNLAIAAVAIAIVILSDPFRLWFFGEGLFHSEGVTALAFLASLLTALQASESTGHRRLALAFVAGLLLAISAYLRVTFELMGLALTITTGILAVIWAGFRLTHRQTRLGAPLLVLAMAALSFNLLTIPWRFEAATEIRPGDYSWTTADDTYWHHAWSPDWYLAEQGWFWLIDGEVNTACEIDTNRCELITEAELATDAPFSGLGAHTEEEFEAMAMDVLIDNPLEWGTRRARLFPRFWFTSPAEDQRNPGQYGIPFGLAIATLALGATVTTAMVSVARIRRQIVPGLYWLTFAASSTAPLAIVQIEARYFWIIAVSAPMFLAWQLGPGFLHVGPFRGPPQPRLARPLVKGL